MNRKEAQDEVLACFDLFQQAFIEYCQVVKSEIEILERHTLAPTHAGVHKPTRYIPIRFESNGFLLRLTEWQRDILIRMPLEVPMPSGVLAEYTNKNKSSLETWLSIMTRESGGNIIRTQTGVYMLKSRWTENPAEPR